MNTSNIIYLESRLASLKPAPNARAEGVRTIRQRRLKNLELLREVKERQARKLESILDQLERDIIIVMEKDPEMWAGRS